MTENAPQALAFGEILYDIFEDGAYLGGAPLNFAWYLRQFGITVDMISAVGRDGLGAKALAALRDVGIGEGWVNCVDRPTGTVDVKLTDGQPQFTINEGVAWDEITLPAAFHAATRLLYFGTLAQRTATNRASLAQLLALKPPHRFFDINLRQHYYSDEIVLTGLRESTIAKLNEEEWLVLQRMTGAAQPREVVEHFALAALVITRGGNGANLYMGGHEVHAPSPVVKVVDAVGAGDAFSAAMAAAAIRGVPLDRALPVACEVGAFVVTRHGAQAALPDTLRQAFS
jgi:fructokinase